MIIERHSLGAGLVKGDGRIVPVSCDEPLHGQSHTRAQDDESSGDQEWQGETTDVIQETSKGRTCK